MMKAKYSGIKEDQWKNRNTGEVGTSYYLDVIDADGSHRMRIPEDMAAQLKRQGLKPMQDIELSTGWLPGQNGSEWLGLVAVNPSGKV